MTIHAHTLSKRPARLRVLHVATRHLRGGAERNLAHFVDWEVSAGYAVDVALGRDSTPEGFAAGVPIHKIEDLVRNPSPVRDLSALRRLRAMIRERRYDMVHTHLSKAGVVGRLAARGIVPSIVHTVHMASFGPGYGRVGSATFLAAERFCATLSTGLAYVGSELRDLYVSAGVGDLDRSMVIHSPIDLGPFLANRDLPETRKVEIKRGWGIPLDAPLVLAVGALEPRKRHVLLLSFLRPIMQAGSVRLAIAGEGPERRSLEELADHHGISNHLHLLGHTPDVWNVMGAADVVVHTSSAEGVPQVVIQALAAGKPVVATDVTGLAEIATESIRTLPFSGEGLAEAVTDALGASPGPVDVNLLEPWTASNVDQEIATFHDRFDPR